MAYSILVEKSIDMLHKTRIVSLSRTRLINYIAHEQACKILYVFMIMTFKYVYHMTLCLGVR